MSDQPVTGTVKEWHDEDGWGVLTSPGVPGDVWAHFSMVRTGGSYATLATGETVEFTWERGDQDGYAYRAIDVRRPGEPERPPADGGPGYTSEVRVTYE
ncbi:cold-shock protein [Actinomadura parmotrematis]|uniref:Cold shock domain-containing protein n=1 Tax=Actinomadura parmotrematis TaxID=2864039 RepID=A0ABS7FW91_9ACTN|nr:cold shock domain-containing protein [Actinomadura parmotrematis]MBW8484701.1 cold shock domain-containing protein [Actinomadura parmotrematis]